MITSKEGELISTAKKINVGNHVWIVSNVTLLKGTSVSDDRIIGVETVASGKFLQPNIVIAGSPAKIVKQNNNWKR